MKMTYYVVLVVVLLSCLYIGQVLGLVVLCDNCKDFASVRGYAPWIPIVKIAIFLFFLIECIKDKNWKLLSYYAKFKEKNIIILSALAESQAAVKKPAPKVKAKHVRTPLRIRYTRPNIALLEKTHELLTCRFMMF